MKRIKLLPSIIMLVMCVGILAMGIYAANPASNTITGTITVNAANAEVTVEVFTGKSTNASDRIGYDTGRASTEIELEDDILMDASTVENASDLVKYYTVKLSTESSKKLVVDTETIQLLDGTITGSNETISDALIITKNHTSYAEDETVADDNPNNYPYFTSGKPYVITCAIKIGELPDEAFTASLDMQFNVCSIADYEGDEINGIDYLYYGEYPQSQVEGVTVSEDTAFTSVYEPDGTWLAYSDPSSVTLNYNADGYQTTAEGGVYGQTTYNKYKLVSDTDGTSPRYVGVGTKLFQIQPLKWRILERDAGTGRTKLMCDTIVEQVMFYESDSSRTIGGKTIQPNNYMYSSLRTYLNKTFYNNAFGTTEKSVMLLEEVVNDDASMGGTDNNNYSCDNTTDYIFALSYQDVLNTDYGFSTDSDYSGTRCAYTSAFAKATGVYVRYESYDALHRDPYNCCGSFLYDEVEDRDGVIRHFVGCWNVEQSVAGELYDNIVGAGYWWLRSPNSSNASYARFVNLAGCTGNNYSTGVNPGCVPALLLGL